MFEDSAFRGALAEAIAGLPEREQLVLSLYYEQELNLREIGAVLSVSESRVCQIHGQATLRLRARLGRLARDRHGRRRTDRQPYHPAPAPARWRRSSFSPARR
jgi:RNA polymerase sigma factor for flagellar operon FliA